ncbi:MAG TPA: hypothetical protein VNZ54_03780, partial [bacterium]|nr:hypothetical protein [bacterium]
QNLGPFSLSGLAGVLDQPGSYVVAAGKSNNPNSFVPLASMQNLSNVSGAFTQVDLSGQPDGVYQLRLTVQDAQQNSATDNTLVSKGKFYYQGQMQNNQFPGGFVACVENPANGHVFAASHPSTLVEFDAQGSVISSYALPGDIGGLALDSQTLYVSLQDLGTVERFAIPSGLVVDGAPIGGQNPLVSAGPDITGLSFPDSMAVSNGQLYVADDGSSSVHVFNTATLAENPVSNLGQNYLSDAFDVAVDAAAGLVYVVDDNRVVIFNQATGLYLREFPTEDLTDAVLDPSTGILYAGDWTREAVAAYDPASGAFLGSTEGGGYAEGQFYGPTGLRLTQAGLLLAGDSGENRVQLFKPLVPRPQVQLQAPLLSLQDSGPFSVNGLVQAGFNPLYPNDAVAQWSVSVGKSGDPASFSAPAITGGGNASGALGTLDLSSYPDGVYDARLKAVTQDGLPFTSDTFVSKGKFRFQSKIQDEFMYGSVACVETAPGGDLLIAQKNDATLVETDPQGRFIRQHNLNQTSADALAVDNGNLYAVSVQDGTLTRYSLPASQGQGMGPSTGQISGLNGPNGVVVSSGVVYVLENGGDTYVPDVRAYQEGSLAELPQSPYGATYFYSGYGTHNVEDLAVDPAAGELYVATDQGVTVFDLASGQIRRSYVVNGDFIDSIAWDAARGLLFATDLVMNSVLALDPQTGKVLGQTENSSVEASPAEGAFNSPYNVRENAAGLLMVS